MKITVLNGSPKGEVSVTVQYVRFIQKKFPDHEFKLFNIAHDISKYEKKEEAFSGVIDEVRTADGVMWAFPLYAFLTASQYKRFIEMIWERGAADAFRDKYACILTTSIHFFDHTAHNYMHGICDDLGMRFTDTFSADMDDIFIDQKRTHLLKWAGDFLEAIEKKAPVARVYPPVAAGSFVYRPGAPGKKIAAEGLKIRIITDDKNENGNISRMIRRFTDAVEGDVLVCDAADMDLTGGCLGCMECAFDNRCVYKDGFVEFFNKELRDADITVYAGAVKDRYLSSRIKMFRDRAFFNGHIPIHLGKQTGFLVSGPLNQLPNLREIFQGMAEMSGANLAGIVSDDSGDSKTVDVLIDNFAARCVDYARQGYMKPQTFLGVGGGKIFRDQIWSRLRFPFDADFKFYVEHEMFDFPQNDTRYLEFSSQMIGMIQDPQMKEAVRKVIKTEMLKGYKKVVEEK